MKKFLSILLMASLCGLMVACDSSSSSNKSTESNISTDSTDDSVSANNESHIKKSLQSNLTVDAEISAPEDFSVGSYSAEIKLFDKDLCKSVLLSGNITKEESYPGGGEALSRNVTTDGYYMETADGTYLSLGGAYLYLEKPIYENIYYAFKPDTYSDYYNADKYSTSTDLKFMTADAAFGEVKNILSQLGITVSDDYEVFALDSDTMTEEYDYVDVKEDGTDSEKATHTFTEDEECYYFKLKEKTGSLANTDIGYGDSESGTYVSGTDIEVCYGKSGLFMMSIYDVYDTDDEIKSDSDILDINAALELLNEKYNSVIITDPITVGKISLEYAAVMNDADKNDYTLVPVWVFEAKQTFEDYTENLSIMFNAFTGEELV